MNGFAWSFDSGVIDLLKKWSVPLASASPGRLREAGSISGDSVEEVGLALGVIVVQLVASLLPVGQVQFFVAACRVYCWILWIFGSTSFHFAELLD
jgi:hypothetical protein